MNGLMRRALLLGLLCVFAWSMTMASPAWASREAEILQEIVDSNLMADMRRSSKITIKPVQDKGKYAVVTWEKRFPGINENYLSTTVKLKKSGLLESNARARADNDLKKYTSDHYMAGIRHGSTVITKNPLVPSADAGFFIQNNWVGPLVYNRRYNIMQNSMKKSYQYSYYKGPWTLDVFVAAYPPNGKRRVDVTKVGSKGELMHYTELVAKEWYIAAEPKFNGGIAGGLGSLFGGGGNAQTQPTGGETELPTGMNGGGSETGPPTSETLEQQRARETQERATAAAITTAIIMILLNSGVSIGQAMGAGLVQAGQAAAEHAINEMDQADMDHEDKETEPDTPDEDQEQHTVKDVPPDEPEEDEPLPQTQTQTQSQSQDAEPQYPPQPAAVWQGRPPLYDPDGGEILTVQDGNYEGGRKGQVWYDGWVDYYTALQRIEERKAEIRARNSESAAFWQESLRVGQGALDKMRATNQKEAYEQWLQQAMDQYNQNRQDMLDQRTMEGLGRSINGLDDVSEERRQELLTEYEELKSQGNIEGARDLYRDVLGQQIEEGEDAAYWESWNAAAAQAGEYGARGTVIASQAALTMMGGRVVASGARAAGAAATGLLSGSVAGTDAAITVVDQGGSSSQALEQGALVFMGTAVSSSTGVMGNVPGASRATKILLPAAGDGVGTLIETKGDVRAAVGATVISVGSGSVNMGLDEIPNGFVRNAGGMYTSGVAGGLNAVNRGGNFKDGFIQGVAADGIARGIAPGVNRMGENRLPLEGDVAQAISDTKARTRETIPLEGQSRLVQEMAGDTHTRVVQRQNPDGTTYDAEVKVGDAMTGLDQLRDTRGSRTAKQAPQEVQEVIINTRNEQIYGPADRRTIATVTDRLQMEGRLRPGDQVMMDTFSTPGAPPSVGADRDGRMVIWRPDPADPHNPKKGTKIEIEPELWENDAYRDFYEHTTELARQRGRDVHDPEHYPEFQQVRQQFEQMKRPDSINDVDPKVVEHFRNQGLSDEQILAKQGLTDEQIDHRTWALMHNQLFTNKYHGEASIDNSDQARRVVWRSDADEGTSFQDIQAQRQAAEEAGELYINPLEVRRENTMPTALSTSKGRSNLTDAEGFGRMWTEKSEIYSHMGNTPEAVAQSQKGVAIYMAQREGLRKGGMTPPPMGDDLKRAAMEISRAPVGVDATPAEMNRLEQRMRDLGFGQNQASNSHVEHPAIHEAMSKLAGQSENLKFATPTDGDGPDVMAAHRITNTTIGGFASGQVSGAEEEALAR